MTPVTPETHDPLLQVEGLHKSFGKAPSSGRRPRSSDGDGDLTLAVNDVSFSVGEGEFVTLIGPSGCGKTTTLRSIAGLEAPDSGSIVLEGRTLFSGEGSVHVPASSRGLGMVFQSYAIWPHLNVFDNVAMPLTANRRKRKLSTADIRTRVEQVLEVTGLLAMVDRSATTLSGGQQQRLALARALATQPKLMLLDEPLSNLDAKLRESMRLELTRLQRQLGLTSVYVTHDQDEALALSTKIVVMEGGKVLQIGTPAEVYNNPASRFVAEFVGTSNIFPGIVTTVTGGVAEIDTDAGPVQASATDFPPGTHVLISVRPESIAMHADAPLSGTGSEWKARILSRAFLGDSVDYLVRAGDREFRCRSGATNSFQPGADVHLVVAGDGVRVLPHTA